LIGCHHDDLVIEDRDERLLYAFMTWVDTVRRERSDPAWMPSPIDVKKSRLFWWIRSGHEPLSSPPPCAFSCPWYEVVTEAGAHHVYNLFVNENHPDAVFVAQDRYELIEKRSDSEMLLGFGPYRFKVFRDIERHADVISAYNGHQEGMKEEILADDSGNLSKGWFIERTPELEGPNP